MIRQILMMPDKREPPGATGQQRRILKGYPPVSRETSVLFQQRERSRHRLTVGSVEYSTSRRTGLPEPMTRQLASTVCVGYSTSPGTVFLRFGKEGQPGCKASFPARRTAKAPCATETRRSPKGILGLCANFVPNMIGRLETADRKGTRASRPPE